MSEVEYNVLVEESYSVLLTQVSDIDRSFEPPLEKVRLDMFKTVYKMKIFSWRNKLYCYIDLFSYQVEVKPEATADMDIGKVPMAPLKKSKVFAEPKQKKQLVLASLRASMEEHNETPMHRS